MFSNFLSKVYEQYAVVTTGRTDYQRALLAWEFDPDLFHKALRPALDAFKEADIPYDLLHARPENSPFRMEEQGFNLHPKAIGNDWSHVTLGVFDRLKEEEWPSVYEIAKRRVPTYSVLRAKILSSPTTGLSYLVLALNQPKEEHDLKKFLASRYDDFTTYDMKAKTSTMPHVSILGFAKKDETRVKVLLPKIQQHVIGAKMRPSNLQLWVNFSVAKHIHV